MNWSEKIGGSSLIIILSFLANNPAQAATITIEADQMIHPASPYSSGACLEDVNHEVYGGLYSQMVFGESFQEPTTDNSPEGLSGMWTAAAQGTAAGTYSLATNNAFVGTQSQRITFASGTGRFGAANQGLNRWGMNFVAGKMYEGCLDVRADVPTPLALTLESADGTQVYAQTNLAVTGPNWEHLDFSLTPAANDRHGRLVISLIQPGSVVVGHAFLEPGAWGRFSGLPVRRDVAEGLLNQGITLLRYGGSMVNAAGYRWKNMIGDRDHRPPYKGTWYPYSTDGWGIPDFLDFCGAAGFVGIPDFNIDETPGDMADFVEYANGPTNTVWGAQRLADGHPEPYGLKYLELGNEERVDDNYYEKFQALAKAIWMADPNIIIIVGDFSYHHNITDPFHFDGADSGITNLSGQQKILQLAKQHGREVWFDLHVWTDGPRPDSTLDGMFSYVDALGKIADGAKHKVVVFELNANNHSQRRALANALAVNEIEEDGRLPVVAAANCLQPDGQNDNGWNQGLLFLDPAAVWLQPPGYVMQMISRNDEPFILKSQVEPSDQPLNAIAKRSEDGKTLVLNVVNPGPSAIPTTIILHGFVPTKPARIEALAGSLDLLNTASLPNEIHPIEKPWQPDFEDHPASYVFPPYSFTVIRFN